MGLGLQTLLSPESSFGKGLAQSGMMDYQKHLVAVMEDAGAGQLSRNEQIAGQVAGRLMGRVVPGLGMLVGASESAEMVKRAHHEGIRQMERRGVPGFETGTIDLPDPMDSHKSIKMKYWNDSSGEAFGGKSHTYLEPADEAARKKIEAFGNSGDPQIRQEAIQKFNYSKHVAEKAIAADGLDDIHQSQAKGHNYAKDVSKGLHDIQHDYENDRLQLSGQGNTPSVRAQEFSAPGLQ